MREGACACVCMYVPGVSACKVVSSTYDTIGYATKCYITFTQTHNNHEKKLREREKVFFEKQGESNNCSINISRLLLTTVKKYFSFLGSFFNTI